jgi:hypothetical protein
LVREIDCRNADCPGTETVVAWLSEDESQVLKFPKAILDLIEEDVEKAVTENRFSRLPEKKPRLTATRL